MNPITRLQIENAAQAAQIAALIAGLDEITHYAYRQAQITPADCLDHMSRTGVELRVAEALEAATRAYDAAEYNERGPRIADGSHTGCTHGTGPGVPRVNGYHCRVCGDGLPGEWNDTEARAAERMRQHWVAFHKHHT